MYRYHRDCHDRLHPIAAGSGGRRHEACPSVVDTFSGLQSGNLEQLAYAIAWLRALIQPFLRALRINYHGRGLSAWIVVPQNFYMTPVARSGGFGHDNPIVRLLSFADASKTNSKQSAISP